METSHESPSGGRRIKRWMRLETSFLMLGSILLLLLQETSPFVLLPLKHHGLFPAEGSLESRLSSTASSWEERYKQLQAIQEKQTQGALMDALFEDESSSSSSSLLPVQLTGQGRLPLSSNNTTGTSSNNSKQLVVLFLNQGESKVDRMSSCMILPLASINQLKLVSFAAAKRPLSKSVLLGLNTLLVNRDGALFDNLPWSTWSVDPQERNRDAANNNIIEKFHLGKRDAYNRFMGKDWQGRSLAIGNMALRLKYMLEEVNSEQQKEMAKDNDEDDRESRKSLAIRVLQLQIRELRMDLADIESQFAIARNNDIGDLAELEKSKEELHQRLTEAAEDLKTLAASPTTLASVIAGVFERVSQWTTKDGENAAPYRGAMGYAPILDSKEDIEGSLLPYTSPYDLLKEIIEDQLNARVIGCVLENTSLLRGNTALGGAIVLQRIVPKKTTTLAGEEVEFKDYDEELGNMDVKGGETTIVECDSDEAIAIALAYDVPLKVDSAIVNSASIMAQPQESRPSELDHILETLPMWTPVDSDMSLEVEGDRQDGAKPSPISIPRTTTSLYDSIFEATPPDADSSLFPTDTPIKSLGELDQLSNEDKAKTLLEMSNFSGRLPRPRVVRNAETNPLDKLMLPLVDEPVRRQYLIRDAEQRGDMQLVAELKASKSRLQMAKEEAESARNEGKVDAADRWESEADFLETLRADITQDEGAYNRFLDRDDWYERDRQNTAKRANKSSFGNLLDGIE